MVPSGSNQHQDGIFPIILCALALVVIFYLLVFVWKEWKLDKDKEFKFICVKVLRSKSEASAVILSILSLMGFYFFLKGNLLDIREFTVVSYLVVIFWYFVINFKCRRPKEDDTVSK
jgi:hypothetical protein